MDTIDDTRRRRLVTGQLAGGIAHDFNNILATLLGSLELMERRLDRLPQEEQDRFGRLICRSIESVQKAGGMTSGLLAFARRQTQPVEPIPLAQLIPDLLNLTRGALGRRIQVTTNFAEGMPPVQAQRAKLELALLALILAIRDEMPDGGQLAISATDGPTHVEISIEHAAGNLPDHAQADLAELITELQAVLMAQETRTLLKLPR